MELTLITQNDGMKKAMETVEDHSAAQNFKK